MSQVIDATLHVSLASFLTVRKGRANFYIVCGKEKQKVKDDLDDLDGKSSTYENWLGYIEILLTLDRRLLLLMLAPSFASHVCAGFPPPSLISFLFALILLAGMVFQPNGWMDSNVYSKHWRHPCQNVLPLARPEATKYSGRFAAQVSHARTPNWDSSPFA